MAEYVAPVKDMMFALRELADLPSVAALPGCEDVTDELVETILEEAGKFAQGVLSPLNAQGDRHGAALQGGKVVASPGFAEAYQQFANGGWTGLPVPTDLGGQGLPYLISSAVNEMWCGANMAFSLCPMLSQGAIEAIHRHGNEELQKLYLTKLVDGTWTGTMNLTESQAGSDLSQVRTRAEPDGAAFRIFGQKIFITWGDHEMTDNIVHLVLARLPDGPPGVKGISLFVVPKFLVESDGKLGKRNDVHCVSLEHKMGIHGSPTAVMAYGDQEGAVGYLVGERHRGLEYMFTMMNHARLGVGLEGVAISERAYQAAVAYAKDRIQGRDVSGAAGSVPIIRHPDVRRMLLSMKAKIDAMRAISYLAAATLDRSNAHPVASEKARQQALVDLLIPIVKAWCTEQAIEITSTALQVHGGMGYIEETGAAQYFRDARIAAIYEGTTGIQAADLVGRKIAREDGRTMLWLLGEISATAEKLQAEGLHILAGRLSGAVDGLIETTNWVAKEFTKNVSGVSASAVPYLMQAGTVLGGWQMSVAALAAQRLMRDGQDDHEYLQAKVVLAEFYATHILPLASAYHEEVLHGSASVLATNEVMF